RSLSDGGPLPTVDLQALSLKATPASPVVGEPVVLDASVRNAGASASPPFNVRWQVDGDEVGAGSHAGVPAGATVPDGNSQLVWTATPGPHAITFTVDSDNH